MRNTSIFVRDGGSIVTVTLGSVVQSFSVISINSLAQTFVQSYDGITNLYWWFLSTRMCAETRRRRLVVSCSWLCFLTLDVRSYSWHQLEVRKKKKQQKKPKPQDYKSIISFHIWSMTIAKCCHCSVIFKAKAWPDWLNICVYYCKIANILYFQLLCFVSFFFIINDLYGVC